MRRTKRHLDELIDRLAAGEAPEEATPLTAFVSRLGSDPVAEQSPGEALVEVLATTAKSAASDVAELRSSRSTRPLPRKWRRRAMISTFLSSLLGKILLGTVAAAAATGGLAATGNLPDPVQEWASDALSTVNVEIPSAVTDDVVLPDEAGQPEDVGETDRPETPQLPEEADETAVNVIDEVFENDPTDDGQAFGEGVADVADDAADGHADDPAGNGDEVGERPDDPAGEADDVADQYLP